MNLTISLISFFLVFITTVQAKSIVKEGIFVFDKEKKYLEIFKNQPDLTIDHLSSKGYEVYGPSGLKIWAKEIKLSFIDLQQVSNIKKISNNDNDPYAYPSNQENENKHKDKIISADSCSFPVHELYQGRTVPGWA